MDTLIMNELNKNINMFLNKTQDHFKLLRNFLKTEFVERINKLEEVQLTLTPSHFDELMNLKQCLLEVQQRFYEMRKIHSEDFMCELENIILQLV